MIARLIKRLQSSRDSTVRFPVMWTCWWLPTSMQENIMGKMLACTCKAKMAGFIVGAKCPIVLTSRGSSAEEKYLAIVVSAAAAK